MADKIHPMTEEQRRRWREEGVFPVECWGQGPDATPLVCPLPDRALLRKLAEAVPAHIQTSGWYATAQRHNHKTVHASVYGDNFRGMGRQAIASVISVGDYSGPLADYIAAACPPDDACPAGPHRGTGSRRCQVRLNQQRRPPARRPHLGRGALVTVYVDDMRAQFGRMVMCHMIADTDEELHAMADRIGVQRRWHQAPPRHDSHYDIALTKRAAAVAAGAVEITWRQAGLMTIRRRATGHLGKPAEAQAWMDEHRGRKKETVHA